ncbi:hypothetical protein IMY05_C0771000900 [Salix suchowensis]|nr:hypothetical protein IMY05_C0771000900 [Salix suchowensis]
MDAFYNKLNMLCCQKSIEKFGLSISSGEGDVASRLTQCNEETEETEEATVTVQGISVTLTGVGSSCFDRTMENCCHAYSMFSRYTPSVKMLPAPEFLGNHLAATNGGAEQHVMVTASSQFSTPVKQSSSLKIVNVNAKINPRGLLAKVDQTKFMHTEDNMVDYYVLTKGSDEKRNSDVNDMDSVKGNFMMLVTPTLALPPKWLKQCNPYAGSLPMQKLQGPKHHARINVEVNKDKGSYGRRVTEGATMLRQAGEGQTKGDTEDSEANGSQQSSFFKTSLCATNSEVNKSTSEATRLTKTRQKVWNITSWACSESRELARHPRCITLGDYQRQMPRSECSTLQTEPCKAVDNQEGPGGMNHMLRIGTNGALPVGTNSVLSVGMNGVLPVVTNGVFPVGMNGVLPIATTVCHLSVQEVCGLLG